MALSSYDTESIVLAELLKFGEPAARAILPHLSHTKFVYSRQGIIGGEDHGLIYQKMCSLWMREEHTPPSLPNLLTELPADYHSYLKTLVDRLAQEYRVYEFDLRGLRGRAEVVNRNGSVFHALAAYAPLGAVLENRERFDDYAGKIGNVTEWANDLLGKLRGHVQPRTEGFRHIGKNVADVHRHVERIASGEGLTYLPVGIPSLLARGLFPVRRLAVIHGQSSAGKSIFTHTVNLGTAIGLKKAGIKGCVAINSLEESYEDLVLKYAAMLSGTNLFEIGSLEQDKLKVLQDQIDFVAGLPIFVDDSSMLTGSVLDFRARSLHDTEDGPIWQISTDYLELLGVDNDDGFDRDTKEQALDYLIHKHFTLSRNLGASVMVISQSTLGAGHAKARIAGPLGTRYSKAIGHAADILLEIWNPIEMQKAGIDYDVPKGLDKDHVWVLIQKYRNGPKGSPIPLGWKAEHVRMFDPALARKLGGKIELFDHDARVLTGEKYDDIDELFEDKK